MAAEVSGCLNTGASGEASRAPAPIRRDAATGRLVPRARKTRPTREITRSRKGCTTEARASAVHGHTTTLVVTSQGCAGLDLAPCLPIPEGPGAGLQPHAGGS